MDILATLKDQLSPDLLGRIGGLVGLSGEEATQVASGAMPALVAGFADKASSGGLGGIESLVGGLPSLGTAEEATAALADPNRADQISSAGGGILDGLFGGKLDAVGDWISSQFGVDKGKGLGMLAMLSPVVLGVLKKFSGGDLTGFLSGLAPSLSGALPAGLGSVLGFAGLSGMSGVSAPNVDVPAVQVPTVDVPKVTAPTIPDVKREVAATAPPSGSSMWLWLIPLLAIAGFLIWKFTSAPSADTSAGTSVSTATPSTGATTGTEPSVSSELSKDLPDGTKITFARGSVEDKLVGFIEDSTKPVDKTTWFTFDRLEFDTGKSTIRASSQPRVEAIASILKAYPNVNLKVGGYTDNVGNPDSNLKLSQARAEATVAALIALGIGKERLEAEGYGEQHPVDSNDTEEGRQNNRRIDVRVTAK